MLRTSAQRRRTVVQLAALGLVVVTAACTSGSKTGGSADGGGSGGGILKYGHDFDTQFTGTFDIRKSTSDCDQVLLAPIYDSLVHKTADGTLEPGLAEKWEIKAPGNKVELWIRKDVKFSDGTPLDGQAVVNGLLTNKQNSSLTSLQKMTNAAVDPQDPFHVVVDYADNTGLQLPYAFTGRDGMIMSTASINANTADQKPVGAGPFVLTSYTKGAAASLRPNPNYWNKANAYKFGGIDFKKISSGPAAVTSLRAGDADFIRIESDAAAQLKNDPTFKTVAQPTGAYLQIEFRQKFKSGKETPFVNQKVREAFNWGIDRAAINLAAQQGLGEVTTQQFPKGSPAHVDALDGYYKYDPAKAKQLLTEAGYPNGFSFDMVIPGGGIANMEHQAVEVQQQLKKIGVTANIKRIMGNDIATGYYIGQTGDAFVAAEMASSFPGGSLNDNFGTGFVANWDGAQNDEVTSLMNQAQSQVALADAMKFVQQAVEVAVKQALDVPIAFMPQLVGYNSQKVGGKIFAQTNICDAADLSQITVKN